MSLRSVERPDRDRRHGDPSGTATSQCKVFNGALECSPHAQVRVILGSGERHPSSTDLPHAGARPDGRRQRHRARRHSRGRRPDPSSRSPTSARTESTTSSASQKANQRRDRRHGRRRWPTTAVPATVRTSTAGFEHLHGSTLPRHAVRHTRPGRHRRRPRAATSLPAAAATTSSTAPSRTAPTTITAGPGRDRSSTPDARSRSRSKLDNIAHRRRGRRVRQRPLQRRERLRRGGRRHPSARSARSAGWRAAAAPTRSTAATAPDTLIGGPGRRLAGRGQRQRRHRRPRRRAGLRRLRHRVRHPVPRCRRGHPTRLRDVRTVGVLRLAAQGDRRRRRRARPG